MHCPSEDYSDIAICTLYWP